MILGRRGLGEQVIHLADLTGGGQVDAAQHRAVVLIVVQDVFQHLRDIAVQPLHLPGKTEQGAALARIDAVEHHVRHRPVEVGHPLLPELFQLAAPGFFIPVVEAEGHAEDLVTLPAIQRRVHRFETVQQVYFGHDQIERQLAVEGQAEVLQALVDFPHVAIPLLPVVGQQAQGIDGQNNAVKRLALAVFSQPVQQGFPQAAVDLRFVTVDRHRLVNQAAIGIDDDRFFAQPAAQPQRNVAILAQVFRRRDVGQFIAFLDQRGFAALLAADHHVPRTLVQVVIAVQMALQLGFPVIEVTGLVLDIDPHRINPFQLDVQVEFFQLAQAAPRFDADPEQHHQDDEGGRQPARRQTVQRGVVAQFPFRPPHPDRDQQQAGDKCQSQRHRGLETRQGFKF